MVPLFSNKFSLILLVVPSFIRVFFTLFVLRSGFGCFPFRSPLLRLSRLILFPPFTLDVSVERVVLSVRVSPWILLVHDFFPWYFYTSSFT